MKIILDASMALSWLFERTDPKEGKCANEVLEAVADSETVVPSLWHTEIANALLVGERRKVVTEAQIIDYLNRLDDLPITTDDMVLPGRRNFMMALAREHGLTAYDATYLDLALRQDAVLATFDKKLADAMGHAGGIVFKSL